MVLLADLVITQNSLYSRIKNAYLDPPTFEELEEFLPKRIVTLEAMCPIPSSGSTQETRNSKDNQGRIFSHNKSKNITSVKSHTFINPNNFSKCPCCSENRHNINSCGVFKGKGVEIDKARHLCFIIYFN